MLRFLYSFLVYKSAVLKPKHCLTCSFLHPSVMHSAFTFPSLWYAVPRVKPGLSPSGGDPEPDDAAGLLGRLGPSDHTLLRRSRTLQVTCGGMATGDFFRWGKWCFKFIFSLV